ESAPWEENQRIYQSHSLAASHGGWLDESATPMKKYSINPTTGAATPDEVANARTEADHVIRDLLQLASFLRMNPVLYTYNDNHIVRELERAANESKKLQDFLGVDTVVLIEQLKEAKHKFQELEPDARAARSLRDELREFLDI